MSRIHDALARANEVMGEPTQAAAERRPVAALERFAVERPQAFTQVPAVRPSSPSPSLLPALTADDRHPCTSPTSDFEGKVMGGGTESIVSAESYANLATVLHETQLDRGLQTLLVTSATPQEGKTLTIVNLAITLSSSYARRVLIVDADLRRPSVHRVFGIAGDTGLSDALRRPASDLPIVQVSPQLSVLPAGRPDPNPLPRLTHDRLQPILAECVSRFDWVLVDTPPLGSGADAQLLARFVQGVIFVIRAGAAPYAVVEKAVTQLGRECIIGTVLNGIEHTVPAPSGYGQFAASR